MNRQVPAQVQGLALDELYGSTHGQAYLNIVDLDSGMVWASTGRWWEVAGEELLGKRWQWPRPSAPINAMGGIFCMPESLVQARLDRQAEGFRQQTAVVARQAARLAAGQRPRGRSPKSDVQAYAVRVAWAQYACEGLRYLSGELHQLLNVIVLTAQGIMHSHVWQGELEALVALLDELSYVAPEAMQPELACLVTLARAALPHLVLFVPALHGLQEQGQQALGLQTLRLLDWAWQRRAILGPSSEKLLEGVPAEWHPVAAPLLAGGDAAVRASSAVENWHSVIRLYVAVPRSPSSGMVAVLAVWHNHRIAERGLHCGQSPLMRSGLMQHSHDWLAALGYPPHGTGPTPQSEADPQPLLALAAWFGNRQVHLNLA